MMRIELKASDDDVLSFLAGIHEMRINSPEQHLTLDEIKVEDSNNTLLTVVKVLMHFGVLMIDPEADEAEGEESEEEKEEREETEEEKVNRLKKEIEER